MGLGECHNSYHIWQSRPLGCVEVELAGEEVVETGGPRSQPARSWSRDAGEMGMRGTLLMCMKARVHVVVMQEPTVHVAGLNCRAVGDAIFSGPEHNRARLRDL